MVDSWPRRVVRGAGETLMWLSMLVFAFTGWQLWATSLVEQRAQERFAVEFDEMRTTPPPTSQATTTAPPDAPSTEAPSTTVTTDGPAPTVDVTDAPQPTTASGGSIEVTITSSTVVPSEQSSASNWWKVSVGEPVARIQIGRIGVDSYIVAGATRDALQQGPGHWPSSPLPGQTGNSVVFGHRTTYGSVFADLDRVGAGDTIVVTLPTGDRYEYTVTMSTVVNPDDVWTVASQSTAAELTLVTCTPKYTAEQRLVVRAVLNASASDVPWQAPPTPIIQYTDYTVVRPITIEPGEPTVEAVAVDELTGMPVDVVVPERFADAELVVVDGEVVERSVADAATAEAAMVTDGWFNDRAAMWSAFGWLAVFAAIVAAGKVGFRLLVARFAGRRRWMAAVAAAGVAAAAPVMWMLFDAVNKVMPAAL